MTVLSFKPIWHLLCSNNFMATEFYITFTLKTCNGTETFARFELGNDREAAYNIFKKLKGSHVVDNDNILYIDFFETEEGLPKNLKVLSCTLPQLQENCGFITKELFKHHIFE